MIRPHRVRRPLAASSLTLAGLVVVAGISSTTASYTSPAALAGSLDGMFDIAQGPCDAPVDGPTSDEAHVVVEHGTGSAVRRAVPGPDGVPTGDTARVDLTVCNLSAVDGALTLSVYDRSAEDVETPYGDLVLAVRAGDTPVTGGVPVPVGQLDAASGGVALPVTVDPAGSASVSLDVWLREDAPAGAFSRPVDLGIRVVGQSIAGDVIELTGRVGTP